MLYQIENKKLFAHSMLWKLQRQYFEQSGPDAWRFGEVPHYVTSNPKIANSYAEVVFGFYKDTMLKMVAPQPAQPIYIIEAGAGSGRFGYYFIKRLHKLCEEAGIPPETFCYVLTDFTQQNIDAWKKHELLQGHFDQGCMDIALFDMTTKQDLYLQLSGITIGQGSLMMPLVFIANYLFDSIPQELLYAEAGACAACRISLSTTADPQGLLAGDLLKQLSFNYEYDLGQEIQYEEDWLNNILEVYRNHVNQGYFFFPETGIRSLEQIRSYSQRGLLVLTADKGPHQMEHTVYQDAPLIVKHGSFSLNVNYHAFELYAAGAGAECWFPDRVYGSINVGCMLFAKDPNSYTQTQSAYRKYMDETGPDDYFTLYHHISGETDKLSLKAILAALRYSLYDSHLLSICILRLQALAPDMSAAEKVDVINTIADCWENYFPLGERADLANQVARFCYEIEAYDCALYYFKLSIDVYGNDTGTLYNMAACYYQLKEIENAKIILDIVLQKDPGNENATELLTMIRQHHHKNEP